MKIKLNGKSKWAFTNKPEQYEGNDIGYSIQVEMDTDKLNALKESLIEFFNEELANGSLKGKKIDAKATIQLPIKEDDNGNELVKAKTKHFYINKATGERINRTLPVFDKFGKPLSTSVNIGNGSEIQVACEASAYVASKKSYGVTLYLTGVLVKELIEYNGGTTASALGLDVEEAPNDEEAEF